MTDIADGIVDENLILQWNDDIVDHIHDYSRIFSTDSYKMNEFDVICLSK